METLEPGDVSTRAIRLTHAGSQEYVLFQPNLKEVLAKLKETHSTSAGLKVGYIRICLYLARTDDSLFHRPSVPGHVWRLSTSADRVAAVMGTLRK